SVAARALRYQVVAIPPVHSSAIHFRSPYLKFLRPDLTYHIPNHHPTITTKETHIMSRKVFIAYDHSKTSEYAVTWVLDHNVLLPTDHIIVANIVDEEPTRLYDSLTIQAAAASAGEWLAEDYKLRVAALEKDAKGILTSVAALIKAKGVGFNVEAIMLQGNVKEQIINYTESHGVDIIIIGSRGLSFFKRTLLGSVSDHVVHHSKASVLLVRAPEEAKH
ncbi:hypothetical protein BC938DRAFT_470556, partial [Jimgerdemannia flammicorona]